MSHETNVQGGKSSTDFMDELLKMVLMAMVSVLAAWVLCEYMLKPLWHIIKLKI